MILFQILRLVGSNTLDDDWVTLNQLIKYYKYGFGRVTDYMNEAIRYNEISKMMQLKLWKNMTILLMSIKSFRIYKYK